MHCPYCGSSDVACSETRNTHSHECFTCGRKDVYVKARR